MIKRVAVQLNAGAPRFWAVDLVALGFDWPRAESQPIADQVMLFNVTGEATKLPEWAKVVEE